MRAAAPGDTRAARCEKGTTIRTYRRQKQGSSRKRCLGTAGVQRWWLWTGGVPCTKLLAVQLVTVSFGGYVARYNDMAANKEGADHTKCRRCECMLPNGPGFAAAVLSLVAVVPRVRRSGAFNELGAPTLLRHRRPYPATDLDRVQRVPETRARKTHSLRRALRLFI